MNQRLYDGKRISQQNFNSQPAVRLSYFFKADSQPEVLANESLANTSVNDSCYLEVEELNPSFPSFRD